MGTVSIVRPVNKLVIWKLAQREADENTIHYVPGDILAVCSAAFADPTAIVKAHSDAFGAAFGACDVPATLNLYEDNAVMIWPMEGEVATGKAEIEKLIKRECSVAGRQPLIQVSFDSRAIGKNYIINVGMWDDTIKGPEGKTTVTRVRTTELLHRSDGKWRYAIDNASIGLPPQPQQ